MDFVYSWMSLLAFLVCFHVLAPCQQYQTRNTRRRANAAFDWPRIEPCDWLLVSYSFERSQARFKAEFLIRRKTVANIRPSAISTYTTRFLKEVENAYFVFVYSLSGKFTVNWDPAWSVLYELTLNCPKLIFFDKLDTDFFSEYNVLWCPVKYSVCFCI